MAKLNACFCIQHDSMLHGANTPVSKYVDILRACLLLSA